MKTKIPIYLSKIIKKYPTILSGRKNIKENHARVVKTKKLDTNTAIIVAKTNKGVLLIFRIVFFITYENLFMIYLRI